MHSEKSQKIIGLILPTASNYFCHTLIDLYEQELLKKGYTLLCASTNHNVIREKEYLNTMSQIADGIILMSDSENFEEIAPDSLNIPIVFISRKPKGCPYTAIVENDYTAVFQTILSLLNEGNDKIALIGSKRYLSTTMEQISAYKEAMETTTVGFHPEWISHVYTEECNVESLVLDMQEKGCSTFFTCTHSLTEKFLDYIYIYNLNHTNKIRMAGFSYNKNLTAMQQSIDLITQPINQIVDLSMQLLFYQIAHPSIIEKDYILKGTLVKRTTCLLTN